MAIEIQFRQTPPQRVAVRVGPIRGQVVAATTSATSKRTFAGGVNAAA